MFAGAGSLIGGSAWLARRLVHPRPQLAPPSVHLLDWSAQPHDIEFESRDGITLRGWFLASPQADDVIVVCHGYAGSRYQVHDLALALWRKGHNVLTFDFRACGRSEGRLSSFGFREVEDVLGAIDYVTTRSGIDAAKIAVVGFSMGGTAALLAAARDPRIRCVVADSAYASFRDLVKGAFRHFAHAPSFPLATLVTLLGRRMYGFDVDKVTPQDVIASISPRPVFVIHGLDDKIIPPQHAERLYEAAGEPKWLWLVDGADHAAAGLTCPIEFIDHVDTFITDAFAQPV